MKVGPLRHRTHVRRTAVVTLSWLTMHEAAVVIGVADSTVRDRVQIGRFRTLRRVAHPRGGPLRVQIADHCVKAEAETRLCECAEKQAI